MSFGGDKQCRAENWSIATASAKDCARACMPGHGLLPFVLLVEGVQKRDRAEATLPQTWHMAIMLRACVRACVPWIMSVVSVQRQPAGTTLPTDASSGTVKASDGERESTSSSTSTRHAHTHWLQKLACITLSSQASLRWSSDRSTRRGCKKAG